MTEPVRMRLARLFLTDNVFFCALVVLVGTAFLLGIYCGDTIAVRHINEALRAAR